MKRVGLSAIGIGVLVSMGLLTVKPGYADENDRATKCTLATLKGRYLFAGTGTLLPPAFGVTEPSLESAAGYHIFNGDGTGKDFVTFLVNGIITARDLAPRDAAQTRKSGSQWTLRWRKMDSNSRSPAGVNTTLNCCGMSPI